MALYQHGQTSGMVPDGEIYSRRQRQKSPLPSAIESSLPFNSIKFCLCVRNFDLGCSGDLRKHISESISLEPVTEAVSAKRGRKVINWFSAKKNKLDCRCKRFHPIINCLWNMSLWTGTPLPVTSSKFHRRWSQYLSWFWSHIWSMWRVWPIQDQTSIWENKELQTFQAQTTLFVPRTQGPKDNCLPARGFLND